MSHQFHLSAIYAGQLLTLRPEVGSIFAMPFINALLTLVCASHVLTLHKSHRVKHPVFFEMNELKLEAEMTSLLAQFG